MIDRFLGGESFRSRLGRTRPSPRSWKALADDVARRFDAFDLTGALERIWVVVRGLEPTRRVARHRGSSRRRTSAKSCRRRLYDLADGIRVVAIALAPYSSGHRPARMLEALGEDADEVGWERVAYGAEPVRSRRRSSQAARHLWSPRIDDRRPSRA